MAIELHENAELKLLEVKASGKLCKADYANFEPAVAGLIDAAGKIKILFVMHDFHGWEIGAVWEDIKFATKHCRDIEKIAMVGEMHGKSGCRQFANRSHCRRSNISTPARNKRHASGCPRPTDKMSRGCLLPRPD